MKFSHKLTPMIPNKSPPVWGAWIEIKMSRSRIPRSSGRPPYGGRGLKSNRLVWDHWRECRPPYGGRGLKFIRLL